MCLTWALITGKCYYDQRCVRGISQKSSLSWKILENPLMLAKPGSHAKCLVFVKILENFQGSPGFNHD